jgi:hypothetical protein
MVEANEPPFMGPSGDANPRIWWRPIPEAEDYEELDGPERVKKIREV